MVPRGMRLWRALNRQGGNAIELSEEGQVRGFVNAVRFLGRGQRGKLGHGDCKPRPFRPIEGAQRTQHTVLVDHFDWRHRHTSWLRVWPIVAFRDDADKDRWTLPEH